jgi:phosphoribosyl-ATP pyrophosphohydrolase/phosphoribosyl-AMP cyclohydrolase
VNFDLSSVKFDRDGLVPVVVQDARSLEVLMLGYANAQTLAESLELEKIVFYSRSRASRWLKGETSGNFLHLEELRLDCDGDAVLALVHPQGPTCHTGSKSCFGNHNA